MMQQEVGAASRPALGTDAASSAPTCCTAARVQLDGTILQLQRLRNTLASNEQLLAENDLLRARVRDLERRVDGQPADKKLRQAPSPSHPSLTPRSTISRLRSGASTSAEEHPAACSEFHLVAYSGDASSEDIVPAEGIITIPVLAKSYVEFVWREKPKLGLVLRRPGDDAVCRQVFRQVVRLLWDQDVAVLTGAFGLGRRRGATRGR
jgi:hypothetical protein